LRYDELTEFRESPIGPVQFSGYRSSDVSIHLADLLIFRRPLTLLTMKFY